MHRRGGGRGGGRGVIQAHLANLPFVALSVHWMSRRDIDIFVYVSSPHEPSHNPSYVHMNFVTFVSS
jgi:hypothetical protein